MFLTCVFLVFLYLSLFPSQVLHDDILAHQQPIMESIHTANQLLDRYGDRLKDQDSYKLRNTLEDLRSRFDVVTVQSYTRNNRLVGADEDLQFFDGDINEFDDWLVTAENKLATASGRVATTLEELEFQHSEQKLFSEEVISHGADLKYVNKAGQKFINNGKVCVCGVALSVCLSVHWIGFIVSSLAPG